MNVDFVDVEICFALINNGNPLFFDIEFEDFCDFKV